MPITPERWQQITDIFHGAIALDEAAAREAYLAAACAEDQSLRAEIDSLLAAHLDTPSSVGGPIGSGVRASNILKVGRMLGPYGIEALLGVGGMGEVYRARDTRLGRTVALKILPVHLRSNSQLLARFEREARTIAGLNHPYICTLYDVGRHDGIEFLVMELIEGETLSSRLRARGRLGIDEAIRLTSEVAEAIASAHARGIIHRDIKPSNIIISSGDHVKVVDFGLARESSLVQAAESSKDRPTEPGFLVGTPSYMSPEQALGHPLDARADLFALGVVLFECLTGELPFEGDTRNDYLRNLISGRIKSVADLRRDVPADLKAVLAHCLERDAPKRLDSAARLAEELRRSALDAVGGGPRRLSRSAIGAGGLLAAAILVAISSSPDPGTAPAGTDLAQLRPFTTSAGEETDSHLSPDQMWMSFIATERGERRLFVQQVEGGEPRSVTLPMGQIQSHVWSPDQKAYACLIWQDPDWNVQIMPTLFGSPIPLQTLRVPQIPRAAKLVRWVGRAIYLQVEEAGPSVSLQRLDLDRNAFERLVGPWTAMRVRGFDVRPDGRQVVWTATPTGSQRDDLWLAPIDGITATQLTGADDESRKRFPLWNGLGTSVIYQSNRGGQVDLWELDLTSRQSVRRTSDRAIERPESTSKNGSLSYQLTSQRVGLWIWNARESRGTQVSDEGLSEFAPSASREGRLRVAFQRSLPSPVEGFLQMDTDIFIADVTNPRDRLSDPRKVGTGLTPRLSPDGRLLAYLQRASDAPTFAQLMVRNVTSGALDKLSSTLPLPSVDNFPADWTEQNLVWVSSEDLYFVARTERSELSRIVHYRVGSTPKPLPATETVTRLTEIYPSSDGRTIAYLTKTAGKGSDRGVYQLHDVDLTTGTPRVVRDLGSPELIRLRGWLPNDAGLVMARFLSLDADLTWTLELMIVSRDDRVRQIGTIDHVVGVSRLIAGRSDLYLTRSVEGIGNLFAYSFATRKLRQVSENSVRDVTFGGVESLGLDYVVGIRHELMRDIHLLDARPRQRRNAEGHSALSLGPHRRGDSRSASPW